MLLLAAVRGSLRRLKSKKRATSVLGRYSRRRSQANEFSVRETEIELPDLKRQVVAMLALANFPGSVRRRDGRPRLPRRRLGLAYASSNPDGETPYPRGEVELIPTDAARLRAVLEPIIAKVPVAELEAMAGLASAPSRRR